ncbi:hypothetical protein [Thalassobius sp. Cn5-15]|uniref:hypothetical protein n=1 Tax=Thalassobius sp. Cn5-15 TaxID=2917763 RepID=UPI001EF2A34F|nr:hypothetical protein [Thalassobius sp. Cn5-15]MCG7492798.1 hypothetical protein [Thalassobius sp. Cn5-15]
MLDQQNRTDATQTTTSLDGIVVEVVTYDTTGTARPATRATLHDYLRPFRDVPGTPPRRAQPRLG